MRGSLLVAIGFLCACGRTPGLAAAQAGDSRELARVLGERERQGTLSNDDAAALARAVAAREVAVSDAPSAVARIDELRPCENELDDVFEKRMATHDAAGARAGWARLESGNLSRRAARAFRDDGMDGYRALGVATLTDAEDGPSRRKAMIDPSASVRRAAFYAARTARDGADVDTLVESARLDPEPLVRTDAVRTLRALARVAGADLAERLRDVWTSADEPLREDLASAWAEDGIYERGGKAILSVLLAQESTPGALAAATAIARARTLKSEGRDARLEASANALLVRVSARGSTRDRLNALAALPLEGEGREAIVRASTDTGDDAVRVAALSRLLASPPDRATAQAALERVAAEAGMAGAFGGLPAEARFALALAGDLRIQAWIERDLNAPDGHARLLAASALEALGRSARAAPLLTDPEPEVRTRAACVLMTGARRKH